MRTIFSGIIEKNCGLVLVGLSLWTGLAYGLATNDDFDTNVKDTTKWGNDIVTGHGVLSETNQALEFRVTGSPTSFDQSVRPWTVSKGPYTADWEVQIDTLNIVSTTETDQQVVTGISIADERFLSNEVIAVHFAGANGPAVSQVGFFSRLSHGLTNIYVAALNLPVTNGAVRIAFNSTTKVVSAFYDTDSSDGYTWIPLGTFGISGAGGADGNVDWGLSDTDLISVRIYGYAQNTAVAAGEVGLDNFLATGLIVPPTPHDFAVTKMKVPKTVTLSGKKPIVTKKAVVTIQNLSPQVEQITAATITNLVAFELQSLAPATCVAPVPVLVLPKTLPVNLAPKKSLNLTYTITFGCANNAGKGAPDFSYTATVNHAALDGAPDTQPSNDVCPRDPSGADKGCGNKTPAGTLGGDVLTDVIQK